MVAGARQGGDRPPVLQRRSMAGQLTLRGQSMKPVKRVEIVVEALELGNVVKAPDRMGVVGCTVIRHVAGWGGSYGLKMFI